MNSKATASSQSEELCLAEAAYAEARGESTEGAVAVLLTAKHRAQNWLPKRSACQHIALAFQRKPVPPAVKSMFHWLAKGVMSGQITDITHGADSFDTKAKKVKGKVTRVIGGHQFYIMSKR
jgi:spore germination cell wall hydrolase CwlJ-like protein